MDYTEPQQFSVWTGPENDVFGFRSILLRARTRVGTFILYKTKFCG